MLDNPYFTSQSYLYKFSTEVAKIKGFVRSKMATYHDWRFKNPLEPV